MSEQRRYLSQLYVVPAVDAVDAGKGQLEISINQGKVPNNVQMQGTGRCLVTFIPQYPGKYVIDVTFNGEQVQGRYILNFILLSFAFCYFHMKLTLIQFFIYSITCTFMVAMRESVGNLMNSKKKNDDTFVCGNFVRQNYQ